MGHCLGLEAAHTQEKKDLAFSVKGGVAEHFRHQKFNASGFRSMSLSSTPYFAPRAQLYMGDSDLHVGHIIPSCDFGCRKFRCLLTVLLRV